MTAANEKPKSDLSLGGSAQISFSITNCSDFLNDIRFLIQQMNSETNEEVKDNYSRICIIYLAFYFESLANLVWDNERDENVWNHELNQYNNRNDIPNPIRKMLAFYKKNKSSELAIDINSLRDLFQIRNRLIAHSKDRTVLDSSDSCEIYRLNYFKYSSFPSTYRELSYSHFKILFDDLTDFLNKYLNLVNDDLDERIKSFFKI